METIASFRIDHLRLERGVFVSRQDRFGDICLTTFDLRLKRPNRESVLDVAAIHSLEHLLATCLRSDPVWGPKTVYVGPMGCRTGLYVIFEGQLDSIAVLPPLRAAFAWIAEFTGPVPGAAAAECGNWRDHDLAGARTAAVEYLAVLRSPTTANLHYPE